MYFPADPFFEYDPIFNSIRDPAARERLIAGFSLEHTVADWAVALRLGHLPARAREHSVRGGALSFRATPSQTVGPFFAIGLPWEAGPIAVSPEDPAAIRIRGTVYDGAGDPVPDSMIETWQADPEGRFADLHGYGGGSSRAGLPRLRPLRGR